MKEKKIRKIELIFYGYGTRQIFELDEIDLQVDYPEEKDKINSIKSLLGGKLILPKVKKESPFTLKGKIIKIKYIGKKFLKKLQNG